MTPYTKLKFHLERHAYKKGQFMGDAPADSDKRYKNHFRVVRGNGGQMCVRMYNTDLISVTEDNHVTINMNNWWTSTTKANLNGAMWHFLGWGGVGSVRAFSMSQPAFSAKGKTYRYYDGMEFDGEGNLLSQAKPFERCRTDRDETAEFRKDIQDSGFKDVWPVLFAAADPAGWKGYGNSLKNVVTQECHADRWPDVAAVFKRGYSDHKEAYRAIVQQCTRDMTIIEATDVTVL